MKSKDNQHLKGGDLVILFSLMVVTVLSYGSYSRHIFSSEKISSDQFKAEILAYQAAQIFLLKSVVKSPNKSRSVASDDGGAMEVSIGEDSKGNPYRFQVIQDGKDNYRVFLSKEIESSADPSVDTSDVTRSGFNLKIDLSSQPET
ncbi:MAG: hypothetical protein JNL11_14815 [Bdellovibrionaceae bacterium]|nr:hypothetical protein [Pseudobdellovibrionaceae bacterium]